MPAPTQGDIFYKTEIRSLNFVNGFNSGTLEWTGKLSNLTNGNTTSFNNTQITVTLNSTGAISISANLAEAGEYLAQFRAAPANNASSQYGPAFSFRVVNPI